MSGMENFQPEGADYLKNMLKAFTFGVDIS
jgi:hypothetical protein